MSRVPILLVLTLAFFVVGAADARAEDGVLDSERHVVVVAPVTALVQELVLHTGDRVEAGQALVRLDTRELELDARVANLEVEGQRTVLAAVELRIKVQARAAEQANRGVERLRTMLDAALASQEDLEDAESASVLAAAELELLGHELARERVQLKLLEAAVEAARLRLDRAQVRAPFSGVVAGVHCGVGDLLREGESPVLSIVDLDRLHVIVEIPATRMSAWAPGTNVLLKALVGRAEHVLTARVERLAPLIDPDRQMLTVFLALGDLPAGVRLLPGLYVSAEPVEAPR